MKNLITLFLMGILSMAYTQTMRITYFRAAETKSNINLYWKTFVEDGQDTFKIYRSINSETCDYDEENWELLTKVPNDNKKSGQYYNTNIKLEGGKRYYRVVWGDYNYKMYTTLTVKIKDTPSKVFYSNNTIFIQDKDYDHSFNLYDANNKLVYENLVDGQSISEVPSGMYIIKNMFNGECIKLLK